MNPNEPFPTTTSPPPSHSAAARRGLTTWQIAGRTAAVLAALGITVGIILFIPDIEQFKHYGYLGVFLVNLLGNATVILPAPSLAITFAMGGILFWPYVGLLSGAGATLGESTAYLAGLGGRAVIENRDMYDRLQYWMENHGMLTLFVLAIIPNPVFDLAGITAGVLKYSYLKFLVATWGGKTIKSLLFAWAGANSVGWMLDTFAYVWMLERLM